MRKITFVGAGRMASAMVKGLLAKGHYTPDEIVCTSADDGTGEALQRETGVLWTTDEETLLDESSILVLAVKPQQFRQLPASWQPRCAEKLVISILAGITLSRLDNFFSTAHNIVRAMPNTPGQIGAGITAYAALAPLTPAETATVHRVLGSLGDLVAVPEHDLDAVTGLSGSGPAYVFEFVAALRDGGIAAGLHPEVAAKLALATVLGSARLQAQGQEPPETLRQRVTSPGGTTMAGLAALEHHNFREAVRDAVLAAQKRSRELAGA